MHTYTPEQQASFARGFAKTFDVSKRCIRKARQGSAAALELIKKNSGIDAPNIGRSIDMSEMAKLASLKPTEGRKKIYCTDGSLARRRETK